MAVSNDLATDRRVARHCRTLQEAGCRVTLVGVSRPAKGGDTPKPGLPPLAEGAECVLLTVRHRRGWRFYAECNLALRRRLTALKPDVVWVNDTDTLPGGWMAARQTGCRLVMDAHELFPEVPEIVHKPLVKAVWRSIERLLMPRCDALLTVCQSIADHYRQKLGVEMTVVRNMRAGGDEQVADSTSQQSLPAASYPLPAKKTLLYQGCVNVGRGVDWAIDALEWLPGCRLVVAGDGDLLEQMQHRAAEKPWHERIAFLGRVAPGQMQRLTAEADVGLVMLEDMGLSYHYALPNRIGDFVEAGVPMVVSDLPEMAAVVRRHGVGAVMAAPGAKALATAVEQVLAREWSAEDFASARADMDWNQEKQKLLSILSTLDYQH